MVVAGRVERFKTVSKEIHQWTLRGTLFAGLLAYFGLTVHIGS